MDLDRSCFDRYFRMLVDIQLAIIFTPEGVEPRHVIPFAVMRIELINQLVTEYEASGERKGRKVTKRDRKKFAEMADLILREPLIINRAVEFVAAEIGDPPQPFHFFNKNFVADYFSSEESGGPCLRDREVRKRLSELEARRYIPGYGGGTGSKAGVRYLNGDDDPEKNDPILRAALDIRAENIGHHIAKHVQRTRAAAAYGYIDDTQIKSLCQKIAPMSPRQQYLAIKSFIEQLSDER